MPREALRTSSAAASACGYFQRLRHVLLDQQHRQAVIAVQGDKRVEHLFDQQGRQAQAGLIDQQQARAAHQRASNGQHLAVPAGHGARQLLAPLLQAGKQGVDPLQAFAVDALVAHRVSPQPQVLLHRLAREHACTSRDHRDTLRHQLVGRRARDLAPFEDDAPFLRFDRSDGGQQGAGLARAVGPQQGRELAFAHFQ
ncbi:hypothetical protein G6F22_013171 [Rhizopus arrhizus]|nr:hypothetical protein G6F22_013171 [Rhizopus arrhizus]